MLRLRDAPNQKMDTAIVLRKNGGDLLADDHIRQMGNFEATIDGVLIG
jgi:hypothetical protein